MRKSVKLYALAGALLVICAAAFAVSRTEEKKEQIKNSGEIILEIPSDSVTALSWENEDGSYSFTNVDGWSYDDDNAFPTDGEKIGELLAQFESFTAAFVIEDVEEYAQYGLDEPVCTIDLTAGEKSYTVKLGDFSKMDEQRYVSIGDGKAYLVEHDPLDEFSAVLDDMLLNDTVPEFETAEKLSFSGTENYELLRSEDKKSACESDIYFVGDRPLDTENVEDYLENLRELSLSDYASYNASDEELEEFGLAEPELTVMLEYTGSDGDGATGAFGSFKLQLSRNAREAAEYEKAVENGETDLPEVTCYARVGDSGIVYLISRSEYESLTAASYDVLRHQELFTSDFDTAVSIEAELEGEKYSFACENPGDDDEEKTWLFEDAEFDVSGLSSALSALKAQSFTDEASYGQREICLTVNMDSEDFPSFKLELYRYDGESCIAVIDGEPTAFVSRQSAISLVEAVNAVILG